jgi:putative nucleotidyltransferase with HDIG domain
MDISLQLSIKFINELIKIVSPALVKHMERTAIVAMELCDYLELSKEQQKNVYIAALLHDIGELIDIRTREYGDFHSNNELHQRYTYNMLNGLDIFEQTKAIAYTRRAGYEDKHQQEKAILSFCDRFEYDLRLYPENLASCSEDICNGFAERYSDFPAEFYDFLNTVSQREYFWFRLQTDNIPRVVNVISPIKVIHLDIDDFQQICTLIARIVDTHSGFTAAHSMTVGLVARELAYYSGMTSYDQQRIEIAGYLHDIGKLYVPISLLEKKSALSRKEYSMLKEHSYKTAEILSVVAELGEIAAWAANHHERLDGSGYPYHLNRIYLDIPSRIVAVADFFTALTEVRPYRGPLSIQDALDIMDKAVEDGSIDGEIVALLHQHKEAFYTIVNQAREGGRALVRDVASIP